jgi:biopolymer transport protein ExbD
MRKSTGLPAGMKQHDHQKQNIITTTPHVTNIIMILLIIVVIVITLLPVSSKCSLPRAFASVTQAPKGTNSGRQYHSIPVRCRAHLSGSLVLESVEHKK